jgi:hypothetical protein
MSVPVVEPSRFGVTSISGREKSRMLLPASLIFKPVGLLEAAKLPTEEGAVNELYPRFVRATREKGARLTVFLAVFEGWNQAAA